MDSSQRLSLKHVLVRALRTASSIVLMLKDQTINLAKPLVEEHFRQAAPFWESIYGSSDVYSIIHRKRRELVLSFAERMCLPKRSKALDVGCGAGSISVGLAELGFFVNAIDPVPEMISLTSRAASQSGLGTAIIPQTGDIDRLPFAAESFDIVLAIGVLPWLKSYDDALNEVRRVLKPGGFFIANIDNRLALHRLLDPGMNFMLEPVKIALLRVLEAFGLRKPKRRVPATTVFPGHFEHALKTCGFEPRNRAMYGFGPISVLGHHVLSTRSGIDLHYRLQQLCERRVPIVRSLGAQYLVAAQKM